MSIDIYIRVSSHGQNSTSQRAEILHWLTAHGHDLGNVQWFEDKETGSNLNRPAFNTLSDAIFAGSVKTVVVWKLDRLARSMLDGINILSKWCEGGVRVVSVTQQIDLSGTVGHLVAGVLFAIAEIEWQHAKERQAAGIAVAKSRGTFTKAKPKRARELTEQGVKAKRNSPCTRCDRTDGV